MRVLAIIPSSNDSHGSGEELPRTGTTEIRLTRRIVDNPKTMTFAAWTSRRRHLEYSWLSSVEGSDVAVGWDPMGYVPSRRFSLYPLDPSALRHDPYWTRIKFLRRPLDCHQDYVADSSAYASLSHDPTFIRSFVSNIKTCDPFSDS